MEKITLTNGQTTSLVMLRLLVGWHFLYEGVVKLYNPSWTAKGYLLSAEFLQPFFIWLSKDSMISFVNAANITGLLLVGTLLLIGFKVRWACVAGIVLLALYYLAHPPFGGVSTGPSEGSYWIVNKNLIEIAALYVLMLFPTTAAFGIERLLPSKKTQVSNI